MSETIRNAMSIDVEDYFQVSAFAPYIARTDWERLPCRVERNVDVILALLDEAGAKATFFTLGWIAERYPAVVRRIADGGHEVASHGYGHERASDLSPELFRADITHAKEILEDLCGAEVRGYRAPSFSISQRNWWAVEEIHAAGYRYSSSIYPVKHDHYGMPEAPRFPYRSREMLWELPPTTVPLLGRNWPAAGGGWFRLLPYGISRWMLRQVNDKERAPCMFYFHPWEVDPGQPRQPGMSLRTRFRHYVNLGRMEARLRRLLRDFAWDRVDRVFLRD